MFRKTKLQGMMTVVVGGNRLIYFSHHQSDFDRWPGHLWVLLLPTCTCENVDHSLETSVEHPNHSAAIKMRCIDRFCCSPLGQISWAESQTWRSYTSEVYKCWQSLSFLTIAVMFKCYRSYYTNTSLIVTGCCRGAFLKHPTISQLRIVGDFSVSY